MRIFIVMGVLGLSIATAAAQTAAPAPAPARPIDFSAMVLDANNKPFITCVETTEDGSKCVKFSDTTLGLLSAIALGFQQAQSNRGMGGAPPLALDEQYKRGMLALKVRDAKELSDLTTGQVELIKNQIGSLNLNTIEVARAIHMLDPAFGKDKE